MKQPKIRANRWALVFALAISVTTWADSPGYPNFIERWVAAPKVVMKNDLGTYESRIFTRYVHTYKGPFPVGSVTYTRAPKSKTPVAPGAPDPYSPDEVAAQMAKALMIPPWRERTQKNAKVYEQYWQDTGRIVRLYIIEEKDYFTVSVAMWRVPYGVTVAIETEMLQRELTGTIESKIPWLDEATASVEFSIEPEAYAGDCPPCGSDPFSQLLCAACASSASSGSPALTSGGSPLNAVPNVPGGASPSNITGLTNAINNGTNAINGANIPGASSALNNGANALNGANIPGATNALNNGANALNGADIPGATNALHGVNSNLPGAINAVNGVNSNLPGAINAVNGATAAANNATNAANHATDTAQHIANQYQHVADQANKNWAETNRQAARAIDLGNKLANPWNDFLIGVGTGAGLAFGGILVNAAVSGLSALVDGLVELITQKKADAEKVKEFQKKMQDYKDLKKTFGDMESAVNGSLTIMHMAQNANINCSKKPPKPVPHPEDEDYCKNQCAPPGHCEPECIPDLPQCPAACNPPLSGGSSVKGLECLITIISDKVQSEKTDYARRAAFLQNPDFDLSGECRTEANALLAGIERMRDTDQKLLDSLKKSGKKDLCDGTSNLINGLIGAERDVANARATLTSEDYRRAWRDAQYREDEAAQERSTHTAADANHQLDVDQTKALDAYRGDMDRLTARMNDGPNKAQYNKYLDWRADQVRYCATHSESWDNPDPNHQALICDNGDCHRQQIESGGAFYCGVPVIGLPACAGTYNRCAKHHQNDEPPRQLKGGWWDDYRAAAKDANDAYWISFKQSKINHDVATHASLKHVTSRATQAAGRAANDEWLNGLLGEQTLEDQTARRHELDDKMQEALSACAGNW